MTRLESPLKREILIRGEAYKLVVSPLGMRLSRKGRRKGFELSWLDFVNGDAALAKALNASLALPEPRTSRPETEEERG